MTLGKDLEELEQSLGYHFSDPSVLQQAMTHKSYLNEARRRPLGDNERLEFLGDAVLDLVISEDLLRSHPDIPEGELSKMKARIVSETALAKVAKRLQIGRCLLLGRGEEVTQGRNKPSLLAETIRMADLTQSEIASRRSRS